MTEPARCYCGSISWERRVEEGRYICASCKRPLWQPIETAPKNGVQILVHAKNENGEIWGEDIVWWDDFLREWQSSAYNWSPEDPDKNGIITHWMPLPEGPKE